VFIFSKAVIKRKLMLKKILSMLVWNISHLIYKNESSSRLTVMAAGQAPRTPAMTPAMGPPPQPLLPSQQGHYSYRAGTMLMIHSFQLRWITVYNEVFY
jgi:hypothetical protein